MERIPSDHDSIRSMRATLVSHGPTRRPAIELPEEDADAVPIDEVVRLSLSGTERHARFTTYADSVRATGAFDAPDLARSPGDGANRLREWVEETDLEIGRTVHLDVIEDGFKYGVRAPGERVVYDAPDAPDDSLASIAKRIERDRP